MAKTPKSPIKGKMVISQNIDIKFLTKQQPINMLNRNPKSNWLNIILKDLTKLNPLYNLIKTKG